MLPPPPLAPQVPRYGSPAGGCETLSLEPSGHIGEAAGSEHRLLHSVASRGAGVGGVIPPVLGPLSGILGQTFTQRDSAASAPSVSP